jgi:hypothetical protein
MLARLADVAPALSQLAHRRHAIVDEQAAAA